MPSQSNSVTSVRRTRTGAVLDRAKREGGIEGLRGACDGNSPSEAGYSDDALVLQAYSQDLWPRKLLELREDGPQPPAVDLVLWPESTEQVSRIVRWASQVDVALYPYGAGSGVCGATIPTEESGRPRVIVDLKRMRAVRSIDRKSLTVWAESGLIGENLERHLNQEGFTLGHFPSSIYCSSLGGYLATRSAGQLSTKYGKIEDMVLSLEFVIPDGTVLETGRAPRSAMGPDWTQLLLGTEGTLGFFTAARLQIHHIPDARVMMGFGAGDVVAAMEFARQLVQEGVRPAVLRIYDPLETSMALSSDVLKSCGFEGGAAMVVIFEGRKRICEAEAADAREIAAKMEIRDLGPDLGEHWWKHRYDVSYKQQLILSHSRMVLDTFEIAATWENLEGVYRAVKVVNVGMGLIMAHFSHFYHTGANIYFTLVSHAGFSGSSAEHYDRIWEDMLKAACEAGATLSHHHGAGVLKNEWIRRERGDWIQIFERVKRGFDPENRLNPSKMGL
jgi:alkyldihydroxyacetonephosphate synthase